MTIAGEHRRTCVACGRVLASKGHYTATFRSLFGDVPIRVRRLLACPCQGAGEAKSFAGFDLEAATVAPELAYVTARYAALAPFGKVADLLSDLLPISGAPNAGTVRNRTMRVGEAVVQPNVTTTAEPATAKPAKPVVVGLDGGYVRSRHRQDERHFEVIAGKVIDAQGCQSRFAFARNSPAIASDAFRQALAVAGVTAETPATVLSDGDAGLWRLQREVLPNATVVLDWWHGRPHGIECQMLGCHNPTQEPSAMELKRIAIDTSKLSSPCTGSIERPRGVCGASCGAQQVEPFFRKLPATEVVLEACGGSHHWGRLLAALGHDGAADPAAIRQALRQTRQERPQRRRGDQRGRVAPEHALRAGQIGRAAGRGDDPEGARAAGRASAPS